MNNKLEILKKRLIYRASYRGTKEMDILLSSFVNKNIDNFSESLLEELEIFLNFEDEEILNFYNLNVIEKDIDKNKISQIFSLCLVGLSPDILNLSINSVFLIIFFIIILNYRYIIFN